MAGSTSDAAVILEETDIANIVAAVVSRPGEFHPQPLSERCGSLSTHTAPIKRTRPRSRFPIVSSAVVQMRKALVLCGGARSQEIRFWGFLPRRIFLGMPKNTVS